MPQRLSPTSITRRQGLTRALIIHEHNNQIRQRFRDLRTTITDVLQILGDQSIQDKVASIKAYGEEKFREIEAKIADPSHQG